MSDLALHFLGELQVLREGKEQPLPPSRKTRALLAYLALSGRSHRRERLCELLWEIPDDPRGSLRWSLSKLRRLVNDEVSTRIIADRSQVAFQVDGASVDVSDLESLVAAGLPAQKTASLVEAETRFRGEFLEGLELPNFHEFSAWCTAERERINKLQCQLLCELTLRFDDQPDQGVDYARRLVTKSPYDKAARANLIRMMVAGGRGREAEQQFDQGSSLLKEIGEDDLELRHALRGVPGRSVAEAGRKESVAALPDQPFKPLVGREIELAKLREEFDRVKEQCRAGCVLVQGEPGIGKSHLLSHARAMALESRAGVLSAGAFESEIVRPFALWNDAFRHSNHPEMLELLSGSERIDRDRLFGSLSELIFNESQSAPVVVLFDDIQWCEESSAAAVHYILRMNAGRPLWVVLAARDQEAQSNPAVTSLLRGLRKDHQLSTINLLPLQHEDISSLIESQVPGVDSQLIGRESRGNPLLAIELARAVADGKFMGTLTELVNERLSRLGPETIDLLQWASVLSPHLDLTILERMTGFDGPTIEGSLDQAEHSGILLVADKGYQFSHDLVTRSIYRGITASRVRYMHRRIAEYLEIEATVDLKLAAELARHASQSGDPALAARSLVLASRLCLRFFANDDACDLAGRGLKYADRLSGANRVCLILDLKEVQLQAAPVDDWETAATEYEALAEQALDHGALGHARLGYHMASELRWAHGNWSGAKRGILQAERVTRGGSEDEHIIGMAEAARCLILLEKDLPEADAMLMEVRARSRHRGVEGSTLAAARGMLKYYENELDEAESLLEEARMRSKASGNRLLEFQAGEYLAMLEIERNDFQAAATRCQALLEIGEKLRQGSEDPFARGLESLCSQALTGKDCDIDSAFEELREVDAKQRLAYLLNRSADLDLRNGNIERAIRRAEEALQNAKILDRGSEILIARTILADAYRLKPDPANCDRQVQALLATPEDSGAIWARHRSADLIRRLREHSDV